MFNLPLVKPKVTNRFSAMRTRPQHTNTVPHIACGRPHVQRTLFFKPSISMQLVQGWFVKPAGTVLDKLAPSAYEDAYLRTLNAHIHPHANSTSIAAPRPQRPPPSEAPSKASQHPAVPSSQQPPTQRQASRRFGAAISPACACYIARASCTARAFS